MLPKLPFTFCQYFPRPKIKEVTKISPRLIQNLHFRILIWSVFSVLIKVKSIPKKKLTCKWILMPKRNNLVVAIALVLSSLPLIPAIHW